MKRYLFSILFLLSSCASERLYVQSDYFSNEDLASFYAKTPDPRQEGKFIGQQLLMGWSLPREYMSKPELRLELTLRYRNREQVVKRFPLKKRKGQISYRLKNDEFLEKKGILTYRLQVVSDKDQVLETWEHQLWTNLLDVELLDLKVVDG